MQVSASLELLGLCTPSFPYRSQNPYLKVSSLKKNFGQKNEPSKQDALLLQNIELSRNGQFVYFPGVLLQVFIWIISPRFCLSLRANSVETGRPEGLQTRIHMYSVFPLQTRVGRPITTRLTTCCPP